MTATKNENRIIELAKEIKQLAIPSLSPDKFTDVEEAVDKIIETLS